MVDVGREEILRRGAGGGFVVVAGDGRADLSLHRTPATLASLELSWYSGLAVARDGAVYFTEAGLVREVTPSGMLVTVAGGGTAKLDRRPVNAMEADLSIRGDGLTGLAIGPGGELYALCRCRHSAYRPAQPPIMFLGRGLP